jgi:hypothetical protein
MCSLPKEWRKALSDCNVQTWSSGMDSSDMGIEFGVDNLIDFVGMVKNLPLPVKPKKSKANLAEMKKIANGDKR